jgi:3-oxoacyl-[acyl-carrier protein] reductase
LEIKNSVVLVTGGAKGLGLAIARHLQKQGAQIIVADLDNEALTQLPDDFDCQVLDVTQPDDAKTVVKSIFKKHGRIDALINNAGVIYSEPMVNIMNPTEMMHDYTRFRDSIVVNMDSVFIMTAAVVEQMVLGRIRGCIINISSISARGNEGQTAYSAAKSGVNAMTTTWSKELGRLGIRCNAVAPGFINTDSTHAALNESIVKHVVSNTPLRRLGDASEVAQAVTSLIENDYINGVILDVNGGLTI